MKILLVLMLFCSIGFADVIDTSEIVFKMQSKLELQDKTITELQEQISLLKGENTLAEIKELEKQIKKEQDTDIIKGVGFGVMGVLGIFQLTPYGLVSSTFFFISSFHCFDKAIDKGR